MRVIGTRRGDGHPGPGQLSSTAIFYFAMCAVFTEHAHKLSLASVGDNGGGANKELQIISNRDS